MASNYKAEITTQKDFFHSEKPKYDMVIRQGYNVEFVEKEKFTFLGIDTECSICMLVMRDPMLVTLCGHSYCNTCLEDLMSSCDGPILCPLDKTVIDKNQIVPDLRLRRILGAMKVFCLNKDDGCDHTPELIDLEAHTDGCRYKMIRCSLCGVRLTRGTLDLHSQKECQGLLPDKINTHETSLLLNMVTELGTEVDRANEKIALLMDDNVKLQQANVKMSERDAKLSNELGALKQANVQLTHELDVKLSDDVLTLKKKIDIIEKIAFKSERDTLALELNLPEIPKASRAVVTGVEEGAKVGYISEIFCNKSEDGSNRCPLIWRVELAKCTSAGDYRLCDEFCIQSGSRMCMKIECVGDNKFKLMGVFIKNHAILSWSCVENVCLSVNDADTSDKICVLDEQGMSITENIAYCFQCILSFTLDRNRVLDVAMDTCRYVPNEMIGDRNERVEQLICEVTPDGKYKLPCSRWMKGNVDTTISESFYTKAGYKICMDIRLSLYHRTQNITVDVFLMKGENDSKLVWPFKYKFYVTIHNQIYEESASIRHTPSDNVRMFNVPVYITNEPLVGVSITEGNQITLV